MKKKTLWAGFMAVALLCACFWVAPATGNGNPTGTYTAEEEGGGLIVPFSCGGGECPAEGWCVGEYASFDGCMVQCYDVDDDGWLIPVGSADCGDQI